MTPTTAPSFGLTPALLRALLALALLLSAVLPGQGRGAAAFEQRTAVIAGALLPETELLPAGGRIDRLTPALRATLGGDPPTAYPATDPATLPGRAAAGPLPRAARGRRAALTRDLPAARRGARAHPPRAPPAS